MVSPILASADPNARFKLVCNRFDRAAQDRRRPLGQQHERRDHHADEWRGNPAAATPCSSDGESVFASSTTATRATTNKTTLIAVVRPAGLAWSPSVIGILGP